jgi:hypothetical protein
MKTLESKLGRVIFARLFENEDLLEAISNTAKQTGIKAGFFILIGTLKEAKLGFYRQGKYEPIQIGEPVEIVSCMGNISLKEEKELVVHAHISVSNEKGEVLGGHLLSGCIVAVTAELVLVEVVDVKLERKFDEKTKLYLWSFDVDPQKSA